MQNILLGVFSKTCRWRSLWRCNISHLICALCAGHRMVECGQAALRRFRMSTSGFDTQSFSFNALLLKRHGDRRVSPTWTLGQRSPFGTPCDTAFFHCEAEWQKLFAILWAVWLHRNEVIFWGRQPSAIAIIFDARALASQHMASMALAILPLYFILSFF